MALACAPVAGTDGGPRDAGGGDAGRSDSGAGPDAGPVDVSVSEEGRTALIHAARGLSAARALAAPLVQDAEQLRDDPRSDRPTLERRMETEARVEDAVAGNSIVTDPNCVRFNWALGMLSATITFTDCVLEATMQRLDGAITLAVSFGPLRFSLAFTDLAIDTLGIDGTVALNVGGTCGSMDDTCTQCRDNDPTCQAQTEAQRTVTLDLTITSSTTASLSFEALTLTLAATETTVDGAGAIMSPGISGDLTATGLTAVNGDCLPSDGTLDLEPAPNLVYRATFLPSTPSTGEVYLQVNGFPPIGTPPPLVMLFDPCP